MTVDPDAVARRFAIRPGCRFLGHKAVGLAVFSMDLRTLVLEPRHVPPIQEFVIRFVMEGVNQLNTIAGLLGLNELIVKNGVVELRRQELIDISLSDTEGSGPNIRLTEKGREVARTMRRDVMQEVTVPKVIYHGLLRKPVQLGSRSKKQFLQPKEAKKAGLTLVRAIPNRYPHPEEIDVDLLDRTVKSAKGPSKGEVTRDIVAVKSVLKMVYTLYEEAVMLEYETEDDRRERQVAFAVDGKLREDYERAFAEARGPELLAEILTPTLDTLKDRLTRLASKAVVEKLGDLDDVEELASRVANVTQQIEDTQREIIDTDRPDTRQVQQSKIEELERDKAKLIAERDSRKVKFLWTPEIRQKFHEALDTAQERLLILSGFISSEVVNQDFERAIEKLLSRGVRIWIGYGFDKGQRRGEDQRNRNTWTDAEAVFRNMHKKYPELMTYRDVGRSHEKRLICDNRFTFGGSFNLLSFSGEVRGRQKLRHEGADLITSAEFCEELYTRYMREFFS